MSVAAYRQVIRRLMTIFVPFLVASLIRVPGGVSAAAADPPPLYRATLPAASSDVRSALASMGVAIDAVGPGTVTTVVDAAGLARLRQEGLVPLALSPLDFPPADSAFHNYAEMRAAIQDIATAHPDIVRVMSAGLSLEGREILAVKVSDDPDIDDPQEPAVLFMALTHAREHLTVEMALSILRLFTGGYGVDPELTNLVNQREIWVLPNTNPDGGEFDIASGSYVYWRKNRRQNADGSFGVDLNRNYGYRWGGVGASSFPGSETYRGPAPFSEPETQVVRDFVLAHPDITAAVSFHTYGELILYPYGYTYLDIPEDMDPLDHQAFVELADQMAASNGYRPEQGSDLYPTTGDAGDWLYGGQGIFGFTFEMYPAQDPPGFYPGASAIQAETQRNHAAVTYLTRVADNPRKVIGDGGDVTRPKIALAHPDGPLPVGQTITLTASITDDVGVTLASWELDGETAALATTPPFSHTLAFAEPGYHSLRVLAFDAGGNIAASEPFTLEVAALAQASLALPDLSNVPLDATLPLTFTHPISPGTLALTFNPPVAFGIIPGTNGGADIVHAAFRPVTPYTLTLTAGRGPLTILAPATWRFTSGTQKTRLPLIWGGGSHGIR